MRTPPTRPINTAAAGRMNAQAALDATSPATQPFAQSDASVFPNLARVMAAAASAADIAASVVFTATSGARADSTPAKRIAPEPLSPSHPNHARKQPSKTNTAL